MRKILFFLLYLVLSACTFSRMNDNGDKLSVEKLANQFYYNLQNKNYQAIYPICAKSFWKEKDTTAFKQSIEELTGKIGALIDYNLIDWKTDVIFGTTKTKGEYTFVYKNKYEKSETTETLKFKYEDDGQIRMVGYTVLLDLLNINAH